MKKIIGISLVIILVSYFLFLSKYLVIEEIAGLYLIPIIIVLTISSFLFFIRHTKTIKYKIFIFNSLSVACILQILIISLILWSAASRYCTHEQVISDIDYAIKVMEETHPNLYANISKKDFYHKTDSIKKSLPEKVSNTEAYKTLGKIFSQIKDGHTGVGGNFFIQSNALWGKIPPFKFVIKNDKLFVSKNYFYRNSIPIGSEILKINGKPIYQCLQEICQLFSYENIHLRNATLQNPLIWGVWNDFTDFEITYKTSTTKTIKTIKSSGGIISKILSIIENNSSSTNYNYKTISGNIGFIKFNSFTNLDKFKAFLVSTFREIKNKGINNLIIDIRKNGGGNSSLGDELLQFISKTDFRMYDSCLIKISNELLTKESLKDIDSTKRKIGTIYNDSDTSKTKLRINPLKFNGQTYLLIGGNTFSSASDFAAAFQCYNIGKIIGTETGGLQTCFGDIYIFELPNTKIEMSVSCKKWVNACGIDNGRGVIPDYIIENSFEDDQKGIDRAMEFTINLIKKSKK